MNEHQDDGTEDAGLTAGPTDDDRMAAPLDAAAAPGTAEGGNEAALGDADGGTVNPPSDEEGDLPPRADPRERRGALKFDRLRLDGFKSFPERVEIDIEPGLTGIVGPNGCGKSNLLESLRWVFGETSAKRMRGAGMDDVIFGGTERRQPRNIAEVALLADNRSRTAPAGMNDSDKLDIVRRIERGQGTSYRVNGKPARLRDVQILFQDNAAGANSSSIVSQGRVSKIIHDKPSDRRAVLEEAAGVSGLSSRRHDTELKLKGTDQNLTRAEDALEQSSEILAGLRKQARQVQRRREIDGKIREATAGVLLIRKLQAARAVARSRADHEANEAKVIASMLAVNKATAEREGVAATLPTLREARAAAETALARAIANLENVAGEADRNRKEIDEAERRMLELAGDLRLEDDGISESVATLARLTEERMVIAERRESETEMIEGASDAVEDARAKVEAEDAEMARHATEVATREANHAAALQKRDETRKRLDSVEARLGACEQRLARLTASMPEPAVRGAEEEAVAVAEERLSNAAESLAACEEQLVEAREVEASTTEGQQNAASTLARLKAEFDGLSAIGETAASSDPASSRVAVEPGFEAAVAAAFGDALSFGRDAAEDVSWSSTATPPPGAQGSTLVSHVSGAPEIVAAAGAALVVEADELARLRGQGVPFGFVAVTKGGDFCRWDGLAGRWSGGGLEAALKRANRIRALATEVVEAEAALAVSTSVRMSATAKVKALRDAETRARDEQRRAFEASRFAAEKLAASDKAGEEARRMMAVAESEVGAIRKERADANAALAQAAQALAEIPEDEAARAAAAAAKRRLAEARDAESRAKIALEKIVMEANQRRARFDAIIREILQWTQRRDQSQARRKDLAERMGQTEKARAEALARPAASKDAVAEARAAMDETGRASQTAAAALEEAEKARDGAEEALRAADSALAVLKETRARLLSSIETALVVERSVDDAVKEKIAGGDERAVPVEELSAISKVDLNLTHDLPLSESRLARLERERETLGAVNFLAEAELAEQEKRYGDIEKARTELRQTVVKLRQAIEEIDREARAKLEDAFRRIDGNFSELFVRLFSGGEAHLRLAGSDDILEAGLEIYASPPGKRLQILSLLSGGEQALTAMALIFAAFISNPAPICVLDEVDAPLDDANADLLCRLVETMAENDATRFLVVTHKPLTMARMNRLYGVTMAERGVSSVTRVDLDKAIAIIDS